MRLHARNQEKGKRHGPATHATRYQLPTVGRAVGVTGRLFHIEVCDEEKPVIGRQGILIPRDDWSERAGFAPGDVQQGNWRFGAWQ